MKSNVILVGIIALLVGGGLGFYGGMQYQQGRRAAAFGGGQFGNGQFTMKNGQAGENTRLGSGNIKGGFRPVNGEIISADERSITVKLQDGSSKIVVLSEKTQINKAETVNKTELKAGATVAIFGTENSDGSVTAQNIQLNPLVRMINGNTK